MSKLIEIRERFKWNDDQSLTEKEWQMVRDIEELLALLNQGAKMVEQYDLANYGGNSWWDRKDREKVQEWLKEVHSE